jgi:hypothetical protein
MCGRSADLPQAKLSVWHTKIWRERRRISPASGSERGIGSLPLAGLTQILVYRSYRFFGLRPLMGATP